MRICIISMENKAEVTLELCVQYCGALCRHEVCATGTAAASIEAAAGFHVRELLGVGSGGVEQVTRLVACRDADLVICIRDASPLHPESPVVSDLIRSCDFHGVPIATGLATARILLQNLSRQNSAEMMRKGNNRN